MVSGTRLVELFEIIHKVFLEISDGHSLGRNIWTFWYRMSMISTYVTHELSVSLALPKSNLNMYQ